MAQRSGGSLASYTFLVVVWSAIPSTAAASLDAGRRRRGFRPSPYYFRTAPVFGAPDGKCDWLNEVVAFAGGRRLATGVTHAVYAMS